MSPALRILLTTTALATSSLHAEGFWDQVTQFFSQPQQKQDPKLRVLVAENRRQLDVTVNGPFKVYDPRTGDHMITRKMARQGIITSIPEGIAWGEEFPGIFQLTIVPQNSATTITIDGVEYPGTITLYQIDEKLNAVNQVDLEAFLTSVVAPLFPDSAPSELLAAIAITARTNAYFLAENPKNSYWAIQAGDVHYNGVQNGESHTAIEDAIAETRYMILSQAGSYASITTPFPNHWLGGADRTVQTPAKSVASKITLAEAEQMAEKGKNASDILQKAFPKASIALIYANPGAH